MFFLVFLKLVLAKKAADAWIFSRRTWVDHPGLQTHDVGLVVPIHSLYWEEPQVLLS